MKKDERLSIEYLRSVIADEFALEKDRINAARILLAHQSKPKAPGGGVKKAQTDAAKTAASKFPTSTPPRLVSGGK